MLMVKVKVTPGAIGVSHSYSVCVAHRVGHGGERDIGTRKRRSKRAIRHCAMDVTLCTGLNVFVPGTKVLIAQTFSTEKERRGIYPALTIVRGPTVRGGPAMAA